MVGAWSIVLRTPPAWRAPRAVEAVDAVPYTPFLTVNDVYHRVRLLDK
jgi:hypothetical protein